MAEPVVLTMKLRQTRKRLSLHYEKPTGRKSASGTIPAADCFWLCDNCTYMNVSVYEYCTICTTKQPTHINEEVSSHRAHTQHYLTPNPTESSSDHRGHHQLLGMFRVHQPK